MGKNCAGMIINGMLDKAGKGGDMSETQKGLIAAMRALNGNLGTVWEIAFTFGAEMCTERFRAFYLILNLLKGACKLFGLIPFFKPMSTSIGLVLKAVTMMLKGPHAFTTQWYAMKEAIFAPADALWASTGDIITFTEIALKIGSQNKIISAVVDKILKVSHVIPFMKVLDKFMKIAIKVVFQNAAVQSLSKGPLKVCQAAMAVLSENPVMKHLYKGVKSLTKYMARKMSVGGVRINFAKIVQKVSDGFDFVIEKITEALKPIIDPIVKAVTSALKPLIGPLLEKLKFPELPKKPDTPGFMKKKKGVNPFSLYHTCAFNLDWVKANGYNQCVCCIMGTMNPKQTIKSLMMYAFKEKLCKLMQHGLKKPIHLSPIPPKCWDPDEIQKLAKEQLALKQFEEEEAKKNTFDPGVPVPPEDKKAEARTEKLEKDLEKERQRPPEEPSPMERAAEADEAKEQAKDTPGASQAAKARMSMDDFKIGELHAVDQ